MQNRPPSLAAVDEDIDRAEGEVMTQERNLAAALDEVARYQATLSEAVARRNHLQQARSALLRAYGMNDDVQAGSKTTGQGKAPMRVALAAKPDRRASNVSDPEKLRGLRRETFMVMLEAGEGGISNDEFRRLLTERLSAKLLERVKAAKGGESRAMMDGHLALRRNASNLGYEMRQLGRDRWALIKTEMTGL